RIEETARTAREEGFEIIATVLTTSPHKDAEKINSIGQEIADAYGLEYLPADLKKKNGFSRSVQLSRKYNLYRQNYCGCIFSKTRE
ncbi:MAG: epoxyqueuosine reductase QueH, partial [bacterium]